MRRQADNLKLHQSQGALRAFTVLGTQRPGTTVVTPLLRSNLPGRSSLQVLSEKDSKLICYAGEAAHLLGRGDLLCQQEGGLVRLQSPLVSQEELLSALRCH